MLRQYGIAVDLLGDTADYWCRDYMPIQVGTDRFVKYDIGEAIAYATLAAEAAGVSSCIIGWMDEERLGNQILLAIVILLLSIFIVRFISK